MLVSEVLDLFRKRMGISLDGPVDNSFDSLAYHSGRVRPGGLFAALPGSRDNGARYIADALESGARVILAPIDQKSNLKSFREDITVIRVEDVRLGFALVSDAFFGEPSARLTVIGLTGTNGKTTLTYLIESMALSAGMKCGVIGTIDYRIGSKSVKAERTTPEASDLQEILHGMVEEGAEMVVMEVSSHALHQKRVDGTRFDFGLFTNLSLEHLDYHGDMETYYQAKRRLFVDWDLKASIINLDDPWGRRLASETGGEVITYGHHADCHIRQKEVKHTRDGIELVLDVPGGVLDVVSPLVGKYNVQNLVAAAAVGWRLGFPREAIRQGLSMVREIPGRFQKISEEGCPLVIVDYAHTPDALLKLVESAREITAGKLRLVFGCGGDRDRQKRPLMGMVAAENADMTVITSDNPRSEDPDKIIEAVLEGYLKVRENGYTVIPDRREAISTAISGAGVDDVVVIAGKGHEDYQLFSDRKIHFDDRVVAREVLEGMKRKKS